MATNPRLVKEIELAVNNQFKVQVICFEFDHWSNENNKKIISSFPQVNFIIIPSGKQKLTEWILSTFLEKGLGLLSKIFNLSTQFKSYAISKRSYLLKKYISKIENTDLVIGHNPGAMYATYYASSKFKCKSGFDLEDYHPGEGKNKKQQQIILELIKSLLPKMDYVSFAAPLIKDEVLKNVHFNTKTNLPIVLNYFSKKDFILNHQTENNKIKFIWFSQNIDFERGLENVIPILGKYKSKIELHLYGNLSASFKNELSTNADYIKFHGTTEQIILFRELSNYDIGLAIEPGKDLNNLLAVSNKLICFFQAGLYTLATDTPAQQLFLNQFSTHGYTFDNNFENFETILVETINNISIIRSQKANRFLESQNYNWENESKEILKNWNNI